MKKVIDTLSSKRLSIYLFLVLLVVSLLGALVPQKELPAFYDATYEVWAVKLMRTFQVTDIYHSWYFLGLLAFLVASLATCTIKRLPQALELFKRDPKLPSSLEGMGCRAELGRAPAFDGLPRLLEGLGLGFTWRRRGDVVYGRRQPYAVLGEVLTHAGLVVIFAAALLRSFGHRDTVYVFEGQSIALPGAYGEGYELFADKVDQVTDPNTGRVTEFRTKARLFRNGAEVARGNLEVNGPIVYGGIGIYQSSMEAGGMVGLSLEALKLRAGARPQDFGTTAFAWTYGGEKGDVTLTPGETKPLGNTGYDVNFVDYFEHFITDKNGFRDDNPELNPAAFLAVLRANKPVAMGLIFKLYPEFSTIRSQDPAFNAKPVVLHFGGGQAEEWAADRKEYLFASGATLVVGGRGETLEVNLGPGEGDDLRGRALAGLLKRSDGRREKLTIPFAERVPVKLADGDYVFRFLGGRRAALTGLTVARDPGLWPFYVGCLLLSLGVAGAMLLRYDELFIYESGGKTFLAGRSRKGEQIFRPAFDLWAQRIKEKIK